MVGGWRFVPAGGWRQLAVGRWWQLAVGGGWWLAVDGPLGRSLRAVLNKKEKKSRSQRTALLPNLLSQDVPVPNAALSCGLHYQIFPGLDFGVGSGLFTGQRAGGHTPTTTEFLTLLMMLVMLVSELTAAQETPGMVYPPPYVLNCIHWRHPSFLGD